MRRKLKGEVAILVSKGKEGESQQLQFWLLVEIAQMTAAISAPRKAWISWKSLGPSTVFSRKAKYTWWRDSVRVEVETQRREAQVETQEFTHTWWRDSVRVEVETQRREAQVETQEFTHTWWRDSVRSEVETQRHEAQVETQEFTHTWWRDSLRAEVETQ